MGHILWLQPIFKEMIWGGSKLKEVYNYDIPSTKTGECWALSAHKNGDCVVTHGEFAGHTLSGLWKEQRELFGNIKGEEFPLLVKIIDAYQDLSVQVHPDDAYAKEHENSLGKTECWYVLGTEEDTQIVMGHYAQNKEEFTNAIEHDDYDKLLNRFPINEGDFFYIPAGTLHAICRGTLIYEAQQSSDVTYRVYDYHRKDSKGNERLLHLQQAIDVTTIPFIPYQNSQNSQQNSYKLENGTRTTLVSTEILSLDKYELFGVNSIPNDKPFQMVSVIKGSGAIAGQKVQAGSHCIICADQKETLFEGEMIMLVCTL